MARYVHPRTVGLPFEEWPDGDKKVWRAAIDTGDDLFDGGLGSDWKPKTRQTVEKAYGNWLRFLRDQKTLSNSSAIEKRFTTSNLRAYIEQLRQRVSSTTVVTQLRSLSQAVRAMSPDADRKLLKLAISRLQATASPSRKKSQRLVSPTTLLELGQKLMQEWRLRDAHDPRLNAMDYRDGLMIALLSLCPIRLENLAAIQINQHLCLDITPPLLRFAPEEMKNGHPLEIFWPVDLQTELQFYSLRSGRCLQQVPMQKRLYGQAFRTGPCQHTEFIPG